MNKIVAFLDSSVSEPQVLIAAMPQGTEVCFIHAGGEGLAQIARHLAGRQGVDSIHLISHGRPGAIELAGEWVDVQAIEAQREQLQAIGAALGEHGDLLIYGCEVAKGEAGQALVRQIAAYTRADIAASSTLTGAAELGGDWELDVRTSPAMAVNELAPQSAWPHVLAVVLTTPDLVSLDDSGVLDDDEITNVTTPTFEGYATAGALVSLYDDDGATFLGFGIADGETGLYSIELTLVEGEYSIYATENLLDGSGDSAPTTALPVTIDITAPAVPVITRISDDTGLSSGDGITSDQQLTIHGTAVPGSTVRVFRDGELEGTTGADGLGVWNFFDADDTLAGGAYDYTATAVDFAGNESSGSGAFDVFIDITAPTAYAYIEGITDDNGEYSGDFATNDTLLTVYGSLEGSLGSGDMAQISNDDGATWSDLVVDGSGDWSFVDLVVHSSDFTYITRVIDLAGNDTGSGDSQDIDIDTYAPEVLCIEVSDYCITDADSGDTFTVTVKFDTKMNTDVIPAITFSPNVDTTLDPQEVQIESLLPVNPGYWEDCYTFIVDYSVSDACVDEDSVTIDVTGAESFWGVDQSNYIPEDEFEIDTHNPSVVSVTYSDSTVNDADAGQFFYVTINFDEAMDTDVDPDITFIAEEGPLTAFPFPESPAVAENWDSTFSSGSGDWTDSDTFVMRYTIVDLGQHAGDVTIDVTGAEDAKGNEQKNYCPDESFQLDTLHIIGTVYADSLVGNNNDDWIYGDNSVDTLVGGGGNDYLDGGQWGDSMVGGTGNDIYVAENTNDKAIEAASGGTDIVYASVNYTLGANVENLTMTGTGNYNGKGNELANIILGNDGNNLLTGLAGADSIDGGIGTDSLTGGAGNDSLTGGTGSDTFIFDTALAANVDYITDFDAPSDTIRLVKGIFTALTTGTLASTAFVANSSGAASTAAHRIILDTDDGKLYYDSDGTGAAAKVQFAVLDVADLTGISNADFVVTLV